MKGSEALRAMAHRAGAYPGFRSMKRLGVFLLPLDGMLVHRRSLPSNFVRFPQQITGTHLYSWVERGTVKVKRLAREHNTVPRPGLEPGPLDPGTSALTMRPLRLPGIVMVALILIAWKNAVLKKKKTCSRRFYRVLVEFY